MVPWKSGRTVPEARARACILALVVVPVGMLACGDGSTGPDEGADGVTVPVITGSWLSPNVSAAGVPTSRYDLVRNGTVLSGEVFWRWRGALERVGSLSGTVDAEGNGSWTTILDDNDWDGVETADVVFRETSGGEATLTGTYEWKSPGGLVRESGSFSLNKPEPVIPPAGTGPLGEAGPWRGAMLYSSIGACHTTGFVMLVSLSTDGATVSGVVSAKPLARGGELPVTLPEWYGYMPATLSGTLESASSPGSGRFTAQVSGGVQGQLDGQLITGETRSQWEGFFTAAKPCEDGSGPVSDGTFVFVSERPVG